MNCITKRSFNAVTAYNKLNLFLHNPIGLLLSLNKMVSVSRRVSWENTWLYKISQLAAFVVRCSSALPLWVVCCLNLC